MRAKRLFGKFADELASQTPAALAHQQPSALAASSSLAGPPVPEGVAVSLEGGPGLRQEPLSEHDHPDAPVGPAEPLLQLEVLPAGGSTAPVPQQQQHSGQQQSTQPQQVQQARLAEDEGEEEGTEPAAPKNVFRVVLYCRRGSAQAGALGPKAAFVRPGTVPLKVGCPFRMVVTCQRAQLDQVAVSISGDHLGHTPGSAADQRLLLADPEVDALARELLSLGLKPFRVLPLVDAQARALLKARGLSEAAIEEARGNSRYIFTKKKLRAIVKQLQREAQVHPQDTRAVDLLVEELGSDILLHQKQVSVMEAASLCGSTAYFWACAGCCCLGSGVVLSSVALALSTQACILPCAGS